MAIVGCSVSCETCLYYICSVLIGWLWHWTTRDDARVWRRLEFWICLLVCKYRTPYNIHTEQLHATEKESMAEVHEHLEEVDCLMLNLRKSPGCELWTLTLLAMGKALAALHLALA